MLKEMKTFKEYSDYLYSQIINEGGEKLSEEDYENLDKKMYQCMTNTSNDILISKIKKIMNLNILNKNVNFEVFNKLPKVWNIYYSLGMNIVMTEKNGLK